jgi:hypothetical protein
LPALTRLIEWQRGADGYTLSIDHWQADVVNGATQILRYDVVKNFERVSLPDTPMWIAARSTLPAKDLKGFRRNDVPPIVAAKATRAPQSPAHPANRLPRSLATNLPGAHLRFFFNGAQKAGSRGIIAALRVDAGTRNKMCHFPP